MKPLEHPDTLHLNAARGWLGLGDAVSASAELENITPQFREHPAVLHARCEICRRTKEWDALIAVAEALIKIVPKDRQGWVHRSFALHELKRNADIRIMPRRSPGILGTPGFPARQCGIIRELPGRRAICRRDDNDHDCSF